MRKNKGAKLKNKLAIFASGAGSNAQAIIDYFKSDEHTEIECIVCNKKTAGVFSIAQKLFGWAAKRNINEMMSTSRQWQKNL